MVLNLQIKKISTILLIWLQLFKQVVCTAKIVIVIICYLTKILIWILDK